MYFSDVSSRITLETGEILMKQNHENKRLYLVLEGMLAGYRENDSGSKQEILRAGKGMFAGVHSFFSKSYSSYAELVAREPTKLAYIDANDFDLEGHKKLAQDFVPVIVNELTSRQLLMQRVMTEKEAALKNLMHSEKMATLGQMAAGLAHELNNAIGVLKGNTEWLSDSIKNLFQSLDKPFSYEIFLKAIEEGQIISSDEARNQRDRLISKLGISTGLAKKLARLNITDDDIKQLQKQQKSPGELEKIFRFWEIGTTLHDMLIASSHAGYVLNSVKQLAVTHQERKPVNIEQTLEESLILLKTLIRQVDIQKKFNNIPTIYGNGGELVQIWVNIIKNACESLLNAKTTNPAVIIETQKKDSMAMINIKDNGPGIPDDLRKKIFQPNVTTKKGGLSFGLGLGLSIVQRLVESYEGSIDVKSKPGDTTFTILLPLNN
jgi:nitrogen-specific signal transduction histidine kinase